MVTIDGALTGDSPCEKSGPPGVGRPGPQGRRGSRPPRPALPGPDRRGRARVALEPSRPRPRGRGPSTRRSRRPRRPATASRRCTCRASARTTRTPRWPDVRPEPPSELLYDGTNPDSQDRRPELPRVPPNGPPAGFAGPNDLWHQHNFNGGLCLNAAGVVIGGESDVDGRVRGRGGRKAPLERRVDAARLGRARLRVQLGRVRRRVPGARWPHRRDRVRQAGPEGIRRRRSARRSRRRAAPPPDAAASASGPELGEHRGDVGRALPRPPVAAAVVDDHGGVERARPLGDRRARRTDRRLRGTRPRAARAWRRRRVATPAPTVTAER